MYYCSLFILYSENVQNISIFILTFKLSSEQQQFVKLLRLIQLEKSRRSGLSSRDKIEGNI